MLVMKGRCKLRWSENGFGDVGFMVKEELCEKVVGVRMVSDNCCSFRRECAEVDLWVGSAKWRKFGGKAVFYDELKCKLDVHSASDLVICLGDFNSPIGRHFDMILDMIGFI